VGLGDAPIDEKSGARRIKVTPILKKRFQEGGRRFDQESGIREQG